MIYNEEFHRICKEKFHRDVQGSAQLDLLHRLPDRYAHHNDGSKFSDPEGSQ